MEKAPAPLLGFNNNVRHRGRVFHIQTEDSGVKSPRIVTHLFADGGRIVKTTRTDYAEHVGRQDMAPVVRKLMKEQHKAMFISLRAGELDTLLEQVCGPLPAEAPNAPVVAAAPTDRMLAEAPSPSQVHASSAPLTPPTPITHSTPVQGSIAVAASAQVADASGAKQALTLSNPALRRVTPAPVQPPVIEEAFDLAVGALAATGTTPAPAGEPRRAGTPPPIPRAPSPSNPALNAAATAPASAPGGYAAPRPTAIFSQNAPDKQSIFGESVISEQSLDEVILSYLAEDLEERPAK